MGWPLNHRMAIVVLHHFRVMTNVPNNNLAIKIFVKSIIQFSDANMESWKLDWFQLYLNWMQTTSTLIHKQSFIKYFLMQQGLTLLQVGGGAWWRLVNVVSYHITVTLIILWNYCFNHERTVNVNIVATIMVATQMGFLSPSKALWFDSGWGTIRPHDTFHKVTTFSWPVWQLFWLHWGAKINTILGIQKKLFIFSDIEPTFWLA